MDNFKLIETLIDEIKKRIGIDGKIIFEKWINQKTKNQGFTALHYAAYVGNINSIKKLIELKADYEAVNKRGINAIHMACQGNKPNSLVYLKEKYLMDIEIRDELSSTPLHWACYNGSEECIMFLLTWDVSLNSQDKEGLTPLHLAVLSGLIKFYLIYFLI
jgi:ankyrin repeat protein